MSAPLKVVMALPKLRRLTREEAARRLGITLAEFDEATRFALVTFADPDRKLSVASAHRGRARSRARPRAKKDGRASAQSR
jgi:hypothetical protein